MLGQPVSMLIPRVVGFRLSGQLPDGATATDLVLVITEMLRDHGVVGKFVEFYGDGVAAVPLANRVTIGNMSPEYGSTAAVFPIDDETLNYLRPSRVARVNRSSWSRPTPRLQGLWHDPAHEATYWSSSNWTWARSSRRSPARSGRRTASTSVRRGRRSPRPFPRTPMIRSAPRRPPWTAPRSIGMAAVVIAAIVVHQHVQPVRHGRGRAGRQEGGRTWPQPAALGQDDTRPGSQVVTDYLEKAGLALPEQDRFRPGRLRLHDLYRQLRAAAPEVSAAVNEGDLAVVSVLSGNRNFEGRINPDVKMNYLASPRWWSPTRWPVGWIWISPPNRWESTPTGSRCIWRTWPTLAEIQATVGEAIDPEMFAGRYADVFAGDERWQSLPPRRGHLHMGPRQHLRPQTSLLRRDGRRAGAGHRHRGRAGPGQVGRFRHHGPHQSGGCHQADSPAGRYLTDHGVARRTSTPTVHGGATTRS